MRARTPGAVIAVVVIATVIVAPFASATFAPGQTSSDPPAKAGSVDAAAQTTTTTATARGEPPESARIVARYPAENGSMVERTVLTPDGVARVEPPVNASGQPGWRVGMTLTDAGANRFASTLFDAGYTENTGRCPPTETRNDEGYCLLLVVDGDVTGAFSFGPQLAGSIESGAFQDSPQLVLAAENESEAVAIWRGFLADDRDATTTTAVDGTNTAVDATTATADESTTGPASDADTATAATTPNGETDASDGTPGFGALPAVAASLAIVCAGLVRRRY